MIMEMTAMPTDTAPIEEAAANAAEAINTAADHGKQTLDEAIANAERTIAEAAKTAERALRDAIDTLREHIKPYRDNAGQQFDEAQRYVTERVKERPMTATLAGLGVGFVLGLLLSNRSR